MNEEVKTVLLEGPGEVRVREVPSPSVGPGDLLVEMKACGLCGSDLEKIQGEYTAAPPTLGHEAVGVLVDVGPGVEGLELGERVFPHHHVPCYECEYCLRGSETMCPEYRRWHLEPGGFSEFFRVPAWNVSHGGVLKIPDDLSFEEGAFIEPLACCIRALDRFGAIEEMDVLVAGAGPMGLLTLQILPRYGARQVMVSEVSPHRLEFAGKAGADAVVNPLEEDLASRVGRMTGGRGADLVVVASGNPRALRQAMQAVRAGGRIGLIGILEASATLAGASDLVTREISLLSSNAATESETRRALAMISEGVVDVRSLVSHSFPLADFQKAVDVSWKAESLKVIIVP